MRRTLIIIAATLLATNSAWAQRKPVVPMSAISEKGRLAGKKLVLYTLRQLDLDKGQCQQARGLIESTIDAEPEADISLEQVYSLMQQMQEAKTAGDKKREAEITQQLRALGKSNTDNLDEFFENLSAILKDEQIITLKDVRARLQRNPSGAVRPVDVFREVEKLGLNEEQKQTVAEFKQKLAEAMRQKKDVKDKDRFQLMNSLLVKTMALLNPDQREKFDRALARLRPDLAYRMRVFTTEEEEKFRDTKKQRKTQAYEE